MGVGAFAELTFPTVGLDESGNTGEDLLNEDQPVYVLASVFLEEAEARETMARFGSPGEVKFKSLRKSPKKRQELFDLLKDLTPTVAKFAAVHKRFMVLAKMVDDLVEPLGRATGFNIYGQGAHQALTEMWFHTLPALCGKSSVEELLGRFVAMSRQPSDEARRSFYDHIQSMIDAEACQEPLLDELWFLIATEATFDPREHSMLPKGGLDPAVTVLVSTAIAWGEELKTPYWMIHDDAAVVERWHPYLDGLFFSSAKPTLVGAGRRQYELPLKVASLEFVDSQHSYRVQLADVVAGAVCHVLKGKVRGEQDEFSSAIEATGVLALAFDAVWPSGDLEPDTAWSTDLDPSSQVASFLTENARLRNRERP